MLFSVKIISLTFQFSPVHTTKRSHFQLVLWKSSRTFWVTRAPLADGVMQSTNQIAPLTQWRESRRDFWRDYGIRYMAGKQRKKLNSERQHISHRKQYLKTLA